MTEAAEEHAKVAKAKRADASAIKLKPRATPETVTITRAEYGRLLHDARQYELWVAGKALRKGRTRAKRTEQRNRAKKGKAA